MNNLKNKGIDTKKRLLGGFFALLLLFNFFAPVFVTHHLTQRQTVFAQDAEQPVQAPTEESGNMACYDNSPKETSTWDDLKQHLWTGTKVLNPGLAVGEWAGGKVGGVVDFAKDPLKWFVCSVSGLLTNAIDFINILITRLMLFDPTKNTSEVESAYKEDCATSTTADEDCYKMAGLTTTGLNNLKSIWRNVLNVSNIILILAFLIMAISTALDLGVFNAYTVKKMLPRIVIAAIAANLSWVIVSVVITGVNYVGIGIQSILIAPFTDGVSTSLASAATTVSGTAIDKGGVAFQGGVLIAIGSIVYFIFATGGAILLPLLAIVLVAILVGFIVFLLRRIVLLMLVMVAPLAFMAWALPGGEQWFKKWWKTLIQTLLIYPYAMVLLGSGIVIANVIGETGGKGNFEEVLNSFLIIIALILPYFLLPTAFKMIGGALGTITGKLNDKSKGLVDRARNAKDNSSYYAGKKGANDAKLAGKKREATAEKVNKYMNGKGLGSRLYKRGMSDSQRGSLQASAENSMIRDITDGHARNNTSGEELSAIIGSSKSSDAEKQAALIRLMQTQDIENISKSKAHLAESEDGVNLFNRTKNQNWDLFSGAGPGAKDLKVGQSKAEIDNEHLAAFKAMPLGDAAKLSQGQWEAYGKINGSQGQAAVSAMYTRVRDYGADDDGDNGKLYPDLKWHDPSYVAPNKRPGGGGTPPTPPAAAAGTGPAPGGGAPTNPPGPGPNPFGGGGATTNPPVPTAAAGGTGPGTVRPSGLWVPNTKPGPAPGGGTPTNPPGPNPPGSNGTPPAGTP
jgi:hypothetical protein